MIRSVFVINNDQTAECTGLEKIVQISGGVQIAWMILDTQHDSTGVSNKYKVILPII